MNSKPVFTPYPKDRKSHEESIVRESLAPIVRTYTELRTHLNQLDAATKVATSGYFNPIHKNHISNIISSKQLPSELLQEHGYTNPVHLTVVVNGDWSAQDKLGGKQFMLAEHRADIVRAIHGVDLVFIHQVEEHHQGSLIKQNLFDIFTKGGDRDFDSLPEPEKEAIIATGITVITDVGFDKKEGTEQEVSSSKLRAAADLTI